MDLSDTLSAEMLSDEVLAEITEQLELTSGQNAREELFERIAEKYNMKKEMVLNFFLKFIQDGFEDQEYSESIGEETEDDQNDKEFSSGDDDLYGKSTVKIEREKTRVFNTPKILVARRKSRSHGIKPLIVGRASKEVPFGPTRRQKCLKCGNICEIVVSKESNGFCPDCAEVEKSIRANFPRNSGDQFAVSDEAATNWRQSEIQEKFSRLRESAEILCPRTNDVCVAPEGARDYPVASAMDFIREAGWSHEEALRLVEDLVVNYTAHILNPQHLPDHEVELQLRESLAAFHAEELEQMRMVTQMSSTSG